MRFALDDDQLQIQGLAREVLGNAAAERSGTEAVVDDPRLWKSVLDLGWPGIAVSASHDGAGFGVVELGLIAEEAGASLADSRLLLTATCATLIDRLGTDAQHARLLPGLLDGTSTAGVAVQTQSEQTLVIGGESADVVIVVGTGGATLVAPSTATPVTLVDHSRRYASITDSTEVESLGGPSSGALNLVLAIASAEMLGVARKAMELSVEHAKTREQFGRPIGSFQAVSHRCAEMFYAVESGRSTAYHALWANEHLADADMASSIAASLTIDNATDVTASAIHVHGGMGFTWEAAIHRYYKRALVDQLAWGSASWHRRRLAERRLMDRAPQAL